MKKAVKIIFFTLPIIFIFSLSLLLSSCVAGVSESEVSIVSTNFAGYDFIKELVGRENSRVNVELLSGGDMHSFNPTFNDIAKIKSCDLFIYVGGESDTAIEELLSACEGVNTFKMIDSVTLLTEEIKEGMETEADGEHGEHGEEYDEHIWTSPVNAQKIVSDLLSELILIDGDFSEDYTENAERYKAELSALDSNFRSFFESVENKTVVFGDRFPIRYFAEEYSLDYYAAFPSCSSLSEPSAKTVSFLVDKIKKENIKAVFYVEGGLHSVADRIADTCGVKSLLFHSCHKVTEEELASGVSYISLMRGNLENLKLAIE